MSSAAGAPALPSITALSPSALATRAGAWRTSRRVIKKCANRKSSASNECSSIAPRGLLLRHSSHIRLPRNRESPRSRNRLLGSRNAALRTNHKTELQKKHRGTTRTRASQEISQETIQEDL